MDARVLNVPHLQVTFLTLYLHVVIKLSKLLYWLALHYVVEHWHVQHHKFHKFFFLQALLPHQQIDIPHNIFLLDTLRHIYLLELIPLILTLLQIQSFLKQLIQCYFFVYLILFLRFQIIVYPSYLFTPFPKPSFFEFLHHVFRLHIRFQAMHVRFLKQVLLQ